MATFTIEITDGALPALQTLVARYNADNGTSLTVAQFLELHLAEMSIQDEFALRVEALQQQTQAELHAAIRAERDRLIAGARPRADSGEAMPSYSGEAVPSPLHTERR